MVKSRLDPTYPMLITGVMSLALSVLSLFLPETKGKHMPQTLQDGELFGADQSIWDFPCLGNKGSVPSFSSRGCGVTVLFTSHLFEGLALEIILLEHFVLKELHFL
ncbi:hypothetical protein HPB48_001833 [Haemaphysalis longicornis]|uniref:Uncharacterized protein n=1 Tax=Haemaphysalis longicornis TaxID=44386 RepID=A0A9J6G685_HAELO|nr:hypothetical protein HPB48_001833 [Haemaphysalis longicornis]